MVPWLRTRTTLTARIDPEVSARLADPADAPLEVIVSASGELEALLAVLPARITVRHVYRLRKGIACTADKTDVRVLADSPEVAAIEADRPVSSQDQ